MSTNSTFNPLSRNSHSRGNLWIEVTIPVFVLTVFIVGLRLWWRARLAGRVGLTDIVLMLSLMCALVQEVLGCIGEIKIYLNRVIVSVIDSFAAILRWGLGHHTAYIGRHKASKALMYFYVYQIFYKVLVGMTKMSFVFLYMELFPTSIFKKVCYVFQALIVAAIIAYTLGTIFQCIPIPYFWNRTIKGGHCIDAGSFWYGHAAWNTAMDILVLLLPIPVIKNVKMGRSQKFAVLGVFGLGSFVIVASVMRMISLNPASKITKSDLTYVISTSNAFLWTQLESCVAIICVCLPTLKGLVSKLAPNIFSTLGRSTKDRYNLEDLSDSRSTTTWVNRKRGQKVKEAISQTDKGLEDAQGSQERIIGITRTFDVEVSSDGKGGETTAQKEMFRTSRS
ncbi:hypothetical protein BJ875DRAFT_214150 [Amylocarpus encephaloides]|uniref:Rhodopsin domain-containing protein n=1 Tax=Amylocarpus encephaloides TaxID=45428 RepID=A0A9P8C029_9HELO|nr:hypothetical protein BJ875DRAFT_214150 [Amylocarpus encephaloides]